MVAMSKIEVAAEVDRKWSVVVSHPNAERLAKHNLENQGFEVYLPLAVSAKPVTTKNPEGGLLIRPFFPRYMFVRLNPAIDRWRSIFSTIGVKSIMVAGETPLVVKDGVVAEIQAREEDGFIKITAAADLCRFQRGDLVRYRTPNGDLDAMFLEPVDKTRAAILFNLLGREVDVVVTLASLR